MIKRVSVVDSGGSWVGLSTTWRLLASQEWSFGGWFRWWLFICGLLLVVRFCFSDAITQA